MDYNIFNEVLLELREEYHKNGSIDDSNKKLDEIIKIITIKFYDSRFNTQYFTLDYIEEYSLKMYGDKGNIARALKAIFKEVISNALFYDINGANIFG